MKLATAHRHLVEAVRQHDDILTSHHLRSWAKGFEARQGYESQFSAWLRDVAKALYQIEKIDRPALIEAWKSLRSEEAQL